MPKVTLTINRKQISVDDDTTIFSAAKNADIYIPSLCLHPNVSGYASCSSTEVVYQGESAVQSTDVDKTSQGCQLCVVSISGEKGSTIVNSCETLVSANLVVETESDDIHQFRQKQLSEILKKHPHSCLLCKSKEGCTRQDCPQNVPPAERCCSKLGMCELQAVADYIGISQDTPRYIPKGLPKIDEPLFSRDYNLCIGCTRCVRICSSQATDALGFAYRQSEMVVGAKKPTLVDSNCRFCGACVEVCPTGALMDKELILADKKESQLVPCKSDCPIGVNIPILVKLVSEGKFQEAAAKIRAVTPFPLTLGYVCFHPCEKACRRKELNEPIAIGALHRFAAEYDSTTIEPITRTNKKVAIIGSGPAGLTAAYFLNKQGHNVVVFESESASGGMLRTGIPGYRLPKDILDKEIEIIQNEGVEIKTGTTIGKDVMMKDLVDQGFNAFFLATGTPISKNPTIDGASNLDGVYLALDILKEVNLGQRSEIAGKVIVIGGGDVAIDAARVAWRLGASEVSIVYRRTKDEMPANKWEIQQAISEGINIVYSLSPRKLLSSNGRVTGVEFERTTQNKETGRKSDLEVDQGDTTILHADNIIFAIGQSPDLSFFHLNGSSESKTASLNVDPESLETNVKGVFAGGDVAWGASTVVNAIADGKKASEEISKYLSYKTEPIKAKEDRPNPWLGSESSFAQRCRLKMKLLPVDKRSGNFAPVDLGFDKNQAVEEANRCLQCNRRTFLSPVIYPPSEWKELTANCVSLVPDAEGVYLLADANKEILTIKGTTNLHQDIESNTSNVQAKYFKYEETQMYTMRETELIQQYVQRHGKMPQGDDDLSELY